MKKFWIASVILSFFGVQLAEAQVVRTVTNLFDSGTGTLRDVIGLCTSGDTVRFSVTGTITLTNGTISFNSGIYIDGPGRDSITVNGGGKYNVFRITGGDVTIKGITIDNADPYGIQFSANSNRLTIDGCALTNCTNESSYGPGVYVSSAKSVTFSNTIFKSNSIYGDGRSRVYGGAVYVNATDSAIMSHCTFESNRAASVNWGGTGSDAEGYGGALYVRSPKFVLSNSLFSKNSASGSGCCGYRPNWSIAQGGAIYFSGASMFMDSCTLIQNRTSASDYRSYNLNQGNALFLESPDSVEISNSVFRSNSSGGGNYVNLYGGCIYAGLNNYLGITNTVVSSNSSREIGALCVDAKIDGKGRVILNRVKIDSNTQSTGNYVSAAFFRDIKEVDIRDSRIAVNNAAGVWTKGVGHVKVQGCLLDSNRTYHVYLNNPSGSNNLFVNNTLRRSQNKAIYLDNTSSNYITNNTFVNNTGDVYLRNGSAEFKNNIFTYDKFISDAFSRSATEVPISAGGNIVKGSSFKNYFTKSNDINTRDPQLDKLDWHGGLTKSYSLSSKSDAIDLGGKTSLTYDQRGFLRDTLADAGSFEYGALDPFDLSIDSIRGGTDFCDGDTLRLLLEITGKADVYTWYKNGVKVSGQTGSSFVIDSLTQNDSGVYHCVVSNAKYQDSSLKVGVSVFKYPELSTSNNDTICTGDSIELSVSGAQDFVWQDLGKDGSKLWVSPLATTTFNVVGTSNGCSSYDSITITVDRTPMVQIVAKDTLCAGDSVTLRASGADDYTWGHTSNTSSTVTEWPGQTTIYHVTGVSKSCSASDSVIITVNPKPVLEVSNDTSICEEQIVWLWASGANNYAWNVTGKDTSSIPVQPDTTRIYTVTGSTKSCSVRKSIKVTVKPAPVVSILTGDSTLCDSGSVILSAKGANSYVWSDGLGKGSSVIVTPDNTTTYEVVGAKDGCEGQAAITVYVFESPDPPILKNGEILETGFYESYQWRWNGTDISGATERTFKPVKNGDYTVRVGEENGCEGESTTKITIDDLVGVHNLDQDNNVLLYPNPNSGQFTLDLRSISGIAQLEVYNAQGAQVHQLFNVQSERMVVEGLAFPSGVYQLVVWHKHGVSQVNFVVE